MILAKRFLMNIYVVYSTPMCLYLLGPASRPSSVVLLTYCGELYSAVYAKNCSSIAIVWVIKANAGRNRYWMRINSAVDN